MKNMKSLRVYKTNQYMTYILIAIILLLTNNKPIILTLDIQTKTLEGTNKTTNLDLELPIQGIEQIKTINYECVGTQTNTNNNIIVSEVKADETEIETLYNNLTSYDQYLLAKIAECEAGNQSTYTKSLIIFTVLNRVNDPSFPNSIEEVIYQNNNGNYQFSPLYPNGSWYYIEPSNDSYNAVELVMYNQNYSNGALYFEAYSTDYQAKQSWHAQNLTYLYKSDNTRFYK